MRFRVLWLDSEGFALYAEHFEYPAFDTARKYLAMRIAGNRTRPEVSGFVMDYADSAFLRRYFVNPGGKKQVRADAIPSEDMREQFPHLFKN